MTTPTVNVTMTLCDQTGANVPGATVVAQLTGLDVYNAQYVFPNPQTFTADNVGHVTMPLFPNALGLRNTNYHITATHPTTGKMLVNVAVYVPNAGCDVTALVGNNPLSNPYPLPSVQPYSINLTALASQISAPNTLIYFTGAGQMSVTPLSAFGRSIISAADQSVLNLSSVLTGPITANSSGVTSVAAQTGTGTTFVMNNAPTLIAPALGTPASGVLTNCTGTAAGLTSGTCTAIPNLTGDVTSVGNATTLAAATVTGKLLTGYVSGAGTVAATDSILQGFQKINGNVVALTTTVGGKAASGANSDITSVGAITGVTATAGDNTTKLATTAFVQGLLAIAHTWTAAQRSAQTVLTSSVSITPDFSASNDFTLTYAHSGALNNPTNVVAGQSGVFVVTQDATGGRVFSSFGSSYKFAGGTAIVLSTTPNAVDEIAYYCESTTRISLSIMKDIK